jgi:hypothetical protein
MDSQAATLASFVVNLFMTRCHVLSSTFLDVPQRAGVVHRQHNVGNDVQRGTKFRHNSSASMMGA